MLEFSALAEFGISGIALALIWLLTTLVKNMEAREERLIDAICANTAVLEGLKTLIEERLGGGGER
jgi:dihydroorotase-like cyclic amidohydrolase